MMDTRCMAVGKHINIAERVRKMNNVWPKVSGPCSGRSYLDNRQETGRGHNIRSPIPNTAPIGKHLGDHGARRRVGGHAWGCTEVV
jgi:hypothetical protein